MTRMAKNLIKNDLTRILLIKALFVAVLVMVVLYFYFISMAISNTVKTSDNLKKISSLDQDCRKMESNYFILLEKIDATYAELLGFVGVDEKLKTKYALRQNFVAKR